MIKSFADETTSDIFNGLNTKAARRIPQRVWKAAKRRLDLLHAAPNTFELSKLSGVHFESLKETKPGLQQHLGQRPVSNRLYLQGWERV